jgi:hypothetical protein
LEIPIILILAVLWAAFFAWPFLQRRLSGTRRDSIGDFSKRVSTLGRLGAPSRPRRVAAITPPRPVAFKAVGRTPQRRALPMSPAAQKRRRDVLAGFAALALVTLVLALVMGGTTVWAVQLLADLLLVGYVVALVQLARRAHERRAEVHYLPQRVPVQSSALVLRRTASS